jgi:predicted oxidoreductase
MEGIKLGKSSLISSRIGYGCWRLTGSHDPTEATEAGAQRGAAAVVAAYENGFTLFDLADVYCGGLCETIFGQVLTQIPEMRSRILIASKCGIRKKGEPYSDSPYRYDFSSDHIVNSCEKSLKRIGVETIDIYMLHRPDYLCEPEEVAKAFENLKGAGMVREFGISNFRPSQVTMLQRYCSMPLIVNQVEISLAKTDAFKDGTLDQCLTEGITPLAWSPLDGGQLGQNAKNASANAKTPHPVQLQLLETLDLVAEGRGASRTVMALAWLLKHPSNIIPIIGSTNPENIKDAADAGEMHLTRDEWYRLMEAAQGERLP